MINGNLTFQALITNERFVAQKRSTSKIPFTSERSVPCSKTPVAQALLAPWHSGWRGGRIAANCGMHLRSLLLNGTPITAQFCRNCHLRNRANEIAGRLLPKRSSGRQATHDPVYAILPQLSPDKSLKQDRGTTVAQKKVQASRDSVYAILPQFVERQSQ